MSSNSKTTRSKEYPIPESQQPASSGSHTSRKDTPERSSPSDKQNDDGHSPDDTQLSYLNWQPRGDNNDLFCDFSDNTLFSRAEYDMDRLHLNQGDRLTSELYPNVYDGTLRGDGDSTPAQGLTQADISLIQNASPAVLVAALKMYLKSNPTAMSPPAPPSEPMMQRKPVIPMPGVYGDESVTECTLYVAHMPSDVTLADIYKVFTPYGRLLGADLLRDGRRIDGKLLRAGFVHYADEESCMAAESALNHAVMKIETRETGRVITITRDYVEGVERPLAVRRYTGTKGRSLKTNIPAAVRPGSASSIPPNMPVQPAMDMSSRPFEILAPRMAGNTQQSLRGRRPWSAGARPGRAAPQPRAPMEEDRPIYMYSNTQQQQQYYPQWSDN